MNVRGSLFSDAHCTHPSYATHNGFYIGDRVQVPDGRFGCIDEIVHLHVHGREGDVHSVVRLDDELWLDGWLTRVG